MRLKFEGVEYEANEDESEAYEKSLVLPDGRVLQVSWLETSPPQVGEVRASGQSVVLLKPVE